MIPNLPRPLLWTEIKTMDEFLEGDPVNTALYDAFLRLECKNPESKLEAVQVFNELYYQLTCYYRHQTYYLDTTTCLKDIETNLGDSWGCDQIITLMHSYLEIRGELFRLNRKTLIRDRNRFLKEIDLARCCIWGLSKIRWSELRFNPKKPTPVPIKELNYAGMDWRKITRNFDLGVVDRVVNCWIKEDDQKYVANLLLKSIVECDDALRFNRKIKFVMDYLKQVPIVLNRMSEVSINDSTNEMKAMFEEHERLRKENKELQQQHEDDDARTMAGFGAPVVEIYESDRPVVHHMTNISNVNFNPLPTAERKASLPGVLATDQAKIYWERLKQKKFVDGRFMLAQSTTRQQAAYIAEAFAEKLEIKAKWKTFQEFWNINNLAQEIYKMKQIGKLPSRSKEIDAIFED